MSRLPTRTSADPNSAADVNLLQTNIDGGGYYKKTITAAYSVTSADPYSMFLGVLSSITNFTLPTASSSDGRKVYVENENGSASLFVFPNGADTLTSDDLTSVELPKKGDYAEFVCSDDNGWKIVAEKITCNLRLDAYAGYGATDNKIMQYTNSREDDGNLFSHNHGSYGVAGLEITIQRSGVYSFSVMYGGAAGGLTGGISLNTTQKTTAIEALTNLNEAMSASYLASNIYINSSFVKRLEKGDVVRPHTNGTAPTTAGYCNFIVTYLGM